MVAALPQLHFEVIQRRINRRSRQPFRQHPFIPLIQRPVYRLLQRRHLNINNSLLQRRYGLLHILLHPPQQIRLQQRMQPLYLLTRLQIPKIPSEILPAAKPVRLDIV